MSGFMRSGVAAAAALLMASSASAAYTLSVDVSGIFSNDPLGAAINEVRHFNLFPDARIIGIAWDVELFADAPSWLSEIGVDVSDGAGAGFSLFPGLGSDSSDTASFSGSEDLVALGLDFGLGLPGVLHLEFFESFNDWVGWDGQWLNGSLTISYVPEPASFGLAALGLLGIGLGGRRRRSETVAQA